MDGLLKEVAGTETPGDAPVAPPQLEEVEIEGEDTLLPSQREKSKHVLTIFFIVKGGGTRELGNNDYLPPRIAIKYILMTYLGQLSAFKYLLCVEIFTAGVRGALKQVENLV